MKITIPTTKKQNISKDTVCYKEFRKFIRYIVQKLNEEFNPRDMKNFKFEASVGYFAPRLKKFSRYTIDVYYEDEKVKTIHIYPGAKDVKHYSTKAAASVFWYKVKANVLECVLKRI